MHSIWMCELVVDFLSNNNKNKASHSYSDVCVVIQVVMSSLKLRLGSSKRRVCFDRLTILHALLTATTIYTGIHIAHLRELAEPVCENSCAIGMRNHVRLLAAGTVGVGKAT